MPKRKPLTSDRQARNAKPEEKPYSLKVGDGLFLKVMPSGSKRWRFRYPFLGKEQMISMGLYPAVSLQDAKNRRDEARRLVANGINPSARRAEEKAQARMAQENNFKAIAEEWLERETHRAESTIKKATWLLSFAIADFGKKPIKDIKPEMILATCRKQECKGHHETARRIKTKCSQVFRYAVSTGRLERDPTVDLRGALKPPQTTHRAAITNPRRVGQLLRDIDSYSGEATVGGALKLAPLVFVRPGELRAAKWSDIDLEAAEWRFTPPKTRNQTRVDLIIPLSHQAVAIFQALEPLTGTSDYVFRSWGKSGYLSESAVLNALKRLGYRGSEMSGHGFRAMAKTIMLEELKVPEEYIELNRHHFFRHSTAVLGNAAHTLQAKADY